jgi:hypothetical protein
MSLYLVSLFTQRVYLLSGSHYAAAKLDLVISYEWMFFLYACTFLLYASTYIIKDCMALMRWLHTATVRLLDWLRRR